MKCFKILSVILALFLLSSCVSKSEKDINELLKNFEEEISAADFRVTYEDERYKYSALLNNSLMCVYADKNGISVQITVSTEKPDNSFSVLCRNSICSFTGFSQSESNRLFTQLQKDKRIKKGKYNLVLSEFDFGTVFIINLRDDKLNTNEHPTLKRPVEEEDISRPTMGMKTAQQLSDKLLYHSLSSDMLNFL